jgi:methionyl-tRNA formyltransferase
VSRNESGKVLTRFPHGNHPLHYRGEGLYTKIPEGVPQDETLATHCGKIKKEDALITLADDPQTLWNKYRAYHGWPCVFFLDQDGKRVKITQARFEKNTFIVEKVIPEGKKEIDWKSYHNS